MFLKKAWDDTQGTSHLLIPSHQVFSIKSCLKQHEMTQTEDRPFTWSNCDKSFTQIWKSMRLLTKERSHLLVRNVKSHLHKVMIWKSMNKVHVTSEKFTLPRKFTFPPKRGVKLNFTTEKSSFCSEKRRKCELYLGKVNFTDICRQKYLKESMKGSTQEENH